METAPVEQTAQTADEQTEPAQVRVHPFRPAALPGISPRDELRPGHVQRIETDFQGFHLESVQLGVHEHPAILGGQPIFTNPVIFKATRGEIRPKTSPCPRWLALQTQDSSQHERVVPAGADSTFGQFSGFRQGCLVQLEDFFEPVSDSADIGFLFAGFVKKKSVPFRPMQVDHQALDC